LSWFRSASRVQPFRHQNTDHLYHRSR
jgi:hypothetical protein